MSLYYVCACCGFTQVLAEAPERCLSCDADAEHVREYSRLADADAELGHLFKRPEATRPGPTASELRARAARARL